MEGPSSDCIQVTHSYEKGFRYSHASPACWLHAGAFLNGKKIGLPRRLQPFGGMLQVRAQGVPAVPRADQVVNFAGNEIVQGSGKAWSLKFVANPADTLQLVVHLPGFGGVMLFRDIDYSLSGRAVTTFKSYPEGTVRAWYRY